MRVGLGVGEITTRLTSIQSHVRQAQTSTREADVDLPNRMHIYSRPGFGGRRIGGGGENGSK